VKRMIHNDFSKTTSDERSWTTTKQKLYDQIVNILINNSYVLIYNAEELSEEEYIKRWAKSLAMYILDEILRKD